VAIYLLIADHHAMKKARFNYQHPMHAPIHREWWRCSL